MELCTSHRHVNTLYAPLLPHSSSHTRKEATPWIPPTGRNQTDAGQSIDARLFKFFVSSSFVCSIMVSINIWEMMF